MTKLSVLGQLNLGVIQNFSSRPCGDRAPSSIVESSILAMIKGIKWTILNFKHNYVFLVAFTEKVWEIKRQRQAISQCLMPRFGLNCVKQPSHKVIWGSQAFDKKIASDLRVDSLVFEPPTPLHVKRRIRILLQLLSR
ncbi:hypothetical protein PoB_002793900 [Plakobranchus ocellatus]|uniref:Uncharacterized protein n=1 Tax=Plakobranchus ocellatus TaxID=259542 RepID=A0AAV4A4B7_9GAST|nr:hypothetical protein PoB_002793900 [Plakobranchus ocellatus]